jgi:hypothetical protein
MKEVKMEKQMKNFFVCNTEGQISLVALLLATGAAVVVLSLVPRTVTEIKLSKQEELAAKALYAAEAGVEEVLKDGLSPEKCGGSSSGTLEGTAYTTTVSCLGAGTDPYVFKNILGQDEAIQINFGENPPASINTYWVRSGASEEEEASLEFILICNDGGNYSAIRSGLNSSGEGVENFTSGTEGEVTKGDVVFKFSGSTSISCPSPQALRIKSLFKPTTLGIQSGDDKSLPVLEYRIYSEGKIEAEKIVQAVEVTRPATAGLSSIFDYAVFSGSGL